MPIIPATLDEMRDHIKRRLMEDWVAVVGNGDAIIQMEGALYPPGTPKNADFEMVGSLPSVVYLAKKTDELRQFHQIPGFNELVVLTFHLPADVGIEGHKGWLVQSTTYDKARCADKAVAIEHIVKNLTHGWGDQDPPANRSENDGKDPKST